MIINEKLKKELFNLEQSTKFVMQNNSLTDLQIENYLRVLEKSRYNILAQIKLYNKNVEFEYEKLKTIDTEYKAELIADILKIYVPEVMPSYKNLKTHNNKRILLNIAEVTKPFAKQFYNDEVFIYIKIFDSIVGWDIDNKYIKPVADGLILSNVIKDDNMSKMSYGVTGEFSEVPHTEIYVCNKEKIYADLEKCST